MIVSFAPSFLKNASRLPFSLQDEIDEKISLFKESPHHPFLKTHKLHGVLSGKWSFSVNYKYRIIFEYLSKDEVKLLAVGGHGIYN
jgi:mRNA-degrading endonuclease YafQ of YafQ-DinJ toxin-antitoxin module